LCELHLNLYDWVDQTPARLALAEAALQQAMKIAPKKGETYVARAQFYGEADDWKQSLEMLELAAKALPNDAKVFNRTALVEERLGLSKEALRDMEKAKELDPRNPNIPNHLKDMYAGVRDYKQSDAVCEAAIANFPNGPAYYQAQEVVNALDRGDVKAARARLDKISTKFDASGYISLL